MTRIPNMPTARADDAPAEAPPADPAGVQAIPGSPAPPEPPPASKEPPQMPFIHSQSEEQQEGAFLTDDQFMHDFLKEDHTVPKAVLIISVVLAYLIGGYQAFAASDVGMGLGAVFGACVLMTVMLGVSCLTSTAAGWVVSKIFGEDYGSVGVLFLRFSAVAAAQIPIFVAINAVVGGLLGLFFLLPVMLLLAMFVAGLDVIRAFLFCAILAVINWVLFAFVMMSIATAVFA